MDNYSNSLEFETNKSIATPPKPIPLMEDEDLSFIQVWYSISIRLFVLAGILGNVYKGITGSPLPVAFYNGVRIGLFVRFPVAILFLIRILRAGKNKGYVEQKLFFYLKSSLLSNLDNSTKEGRKDLIKCSKGVYKILDGKEYWKNNKVDRFYNPQEDKDNIEEDYKRRLSSLKKSYAILYPKN